MSEVKLQCQNAVSIYGGVVASPQMPATYSALREVRKNSTVALARKVSMAGIIDAGWGLTGENASDETMDLAQKIINNLRRTFVENAMRNLYDFGFAAFEQWLNEEEELELKALAPESVKVRIDKLGDFAGLEIQSLWDATPVILDVDQSVFIGYEPEAGCFFGTDYPLELARPAALEWKQVQTIADRYDLKISGSFLTLFYPPGQGTLNGETADNRVLALAYLKSLEGTGSAAIAEGGPQALDDMNSTLPPRWHVELTGDATARQTQFIERMRYLDSLLVRSYYLPERSVLESQHGTLSESENQVNFSMIALESQHTSLTAEFSRQLLKPYITLMLGRMAADSITLVAGPISRVDKLYKQRLLSELIKINPSAVDLDSLLDEVGVPKSKKITEPVGV